MLRGNYHFNKHLQAAWNKYGEEYFSFSVLLVCDKKLLTDYEQKFLDILQPGYNKSPLATSSLGRKMSEESKKRISLAKKGVPHKNKRIGVVFSEERKKGCARSGERHGLAKLTEAKVRKIYDLLSAKQLSRKEIAQLFNVTVACVADIAARRSWKHLDLKNTMTKCENTVARGGGSHE
jgi:group I intron endonuclease